MPCHSWVESGFSLPSSSSSSLSLHLIIHVGFHIPDLALSHSEGLCCPRAHLWDYRCPSGTGTFCRTDNSEIWRLMLGCGKCSHPLLEKRCLGAHEWYTCHLHLQILRERHFGIGTRDGDRFQRPFSHHDDSLTMEPGFKDLCPLQ